MFGKRPKPTSERSSSRLALEPHELVPRQRCACRYRRRARALMGAFTDSQPARQTGRQYFKLEALHFKIEALYFNFETKYFKLEALHFKIEVRRPAHCMRAQCICCAIVVAARGASISTGCATILLPAQGIAEKDRCAKDPIWIFCSVPMRSVLVA